MKKIVLVLCAATGLICSVLYGAPGPQEKTVRVPAVPDAGLSAAESFRPAVLHPRLIFRNESRTSEAETEVRLIMDRKNLYVMVRCEEPLQVKPAKPSENPWRGDCVELFFARRGRPFWYRHLIVGADGRRASLMMHESQWSAVTVCGKKRWETRVTIPLNSLGRLDGDLGFNLLRTRQAARELITWQPLGKQVLAPDRFGRLEFPGSSVNLFHAPWPFRITSDSAGIAWEKVQAGPGTAFLRKQGGKVWHQLHSDRKDTIHSVQAGNLQGNTVYEYWVPGMAEFGTFRTLSAAPADFSFILASDVHCRARQLADLLTSSYARNGELLFLLGDQIDASLARENHYDGFLDAVLGVWKSPFYCLYGNHEGRGAAAASFYDLFCGGGAGYWSFVHKGVCFVLLDTDHDGRIAPQYLKEQTEFLRRTVNSPAFRNAQWRILLLHVPLTFRSDKRWGEDNFTILQSLTPEGRDSFDLAFSGHTHVYCRTFPGNPKVYSTHPKYTKLKTRPFSFPEFTAPQLGLIRADKSADTLTVEVFAPSGERLDRQVIRRKK